MPLALQYLILHSCKLNSDATSDPSSGITSAQVDTLFRCNTMNIFSFELTDQSTLKAATCMFLDVDLRSRELLVSSCIISHFRFDELFTRLTMEPFAEKPVNDLASISFCTYRVRGEQRHVWRCVTQFNSIRHGRETAESPRSRNCRNRHGRETSEIVCNALSLISTHTFRLLPAKFLAWDMRKVVKRIEQDEKISFALLAFKIQMFQPLRTAKPIRILS